MRLSSESRLESWAGWWRVIDLAGVCVYTCTVLCSARKSVRAKLVFVCECISHQLLKVRWRGRGGGKAKGCVY